MLGGYNRLYGAASLGAGVLLHNGEGYCTGRRMERNAVQPRHGNGKQQSAVGSRRVLVRNADKSRGEYRVSYPKSEYIGHWWSPDGERMVMENCEGGTIWILMTTWVRSNVTIMNNVFLYADTEYRFLQWSKDGKMMLVYYCMEDETECYFWYDVEKWDTAAEVEMK